MDFDLVRWSEYYAEDGRASLGASLQYPYHDNEAGKKELFAWMKSTIEAVRAVVPHGGSLERRSYLNDSLWQYEINVEPFLPTTVLLIDGEMVEENYERENHYLVQFVFVMPTVDDLRPIRELRQFQNIQVYDASTREERITVLP